MGRNTQICFCVGAGATGKTSVVDRLSKHPDVVAHQSITRDFFQQRGYKSEADLLQKLDPVQIVEFQLELFEHYCQEVSRRIVYNKLNLFERSPICHASYVLYHAREFASQELFDTVLGRCFYLLEVCEPLSVGNAGKPATTLVEFPFPTPWFSQLSAESDKFRSLPFTKNLSVAALQYKILDSLVHKKGHTFHVVRLPAGSPVEHRVLTMKHKFDLWGSYL